MGGLLGTLGSIGNAISGGLTTAAQQGEAAGIAGEGQSSVASNAGTSQQQSADSAQNQINSAQGQIQTNQQNAAAANATQAEVDQGNALLDQTKINAAEEKQRDEGFNAALGSMS